jgi:hypothetical protein
MTEILASKKRLESFKSFHRKVESFKFRIYLMAKLPSAFFSGVKVISLNNEVCYTSVPYKWFSQNPFKSTYFAVQSMAAELSTGLPAIMAIENKKPRVSMLVVNMEAEFVKKSVGLTIFECREVGKIINAAELAVQTGEGQIVRALVVGKDKEGNIISNFHFTWSFKSKSK